MRCPVLQELLLVSLIEQQLNQQQYFKCRAYRIIPNTSEPEKQNLAIDGERYPFGPFEVEIHQGLASFLSPYGAFVDEFSVPKPPNSKTHKSSDGVETKPGLKSKLPCLPA